MFRFESPEYLYILIAIPILVLLFWFNRRLRLKRLKQLGKPEYVRPLLADSSAVRVWVKFSLLMVVVAFVVLTVARPQLGMRMKSNHVAGIEVVVALDVSNSMMASDIAPTRLDKAKQIVSTLCSRLKNDKIALVIFAGNAFLQMPMSADNVSVDMFLDAINTKMIPVQGTSIAEALSVSKGSFSLQKDVKQAIVLITDGEDHEGGVDDILSELKSMDTNVYVLGIGDTKGAPIKMGNDYMRDAQGNVVLTRLNEEMCRSIASKADGLYIHIDNSNSAQEQLVDELNQLQRTNLETSSYEEYAELFPWLAMIALVLLILEVMIMPRRSHYFDKWNFLKVHSPGRKTLLILMLMGSTMAFAQSETKVQTHKGNKAMERKLDSLAIIHFKKAIAIDSMNYKAHYNLGNAYLRSGKSDDAMKEYDKSAKLMPSRIIKTAIYHNMGVVSYASGQYDKAVDSFKEALRTNPKDNRTRYNLALAQYMLKKNPPQNQNQQQDQQNKDNKDNNKNDKDKQQQPQQDNEKQQQQNQHNISKQNAEQMLRAVQMKERQTQEKLKHKQVPAMHRHYEKNW